MTMFNAKCNDVHGMFTATKPLHFTPDNPTRGNGENILSKRVSMMSRPNMRIHDRAHGRGKDDCPQVTVWQLVESYDPCDPYACVLKEKPKHSWAPITNMV